MLVNRKYSEMFQPFYEQPAGGEGGATPSSNDDNNGNGTQSFADVLKNNPAFQSELDRRINQAVETATKNERERQKLIKDQMQDEVLRVSKMTDAERESYFKTKEEKKAMEREADLTRRELTLDARSMLQDKHLPEGFLELLNYTDKDACKKSVDVLDVAFQQAVHDAVEEKLKGNQPPKDAKTEGSEPSAESEYEKALKQAAKIAGIRLK